MLLHHIKSEMEATDWRDTFYEAIGAALTKIQRYHEKTIVTSIIATVLDPRFKTSHLKKKIPLSTKKMHTIWWIAFIKMNMLRHQHKISRKQFPAMISIYSILDQSNHRTNFRRTETARWKPLRRASLVENKAEILARMARNYLAVPGTSAPSERLFDC